MSSHLLSLPGELRNEVYKLVLWKAEGLEFVKIGAKSGNLSWYLPEAELIISNNEILGHSEIALTSPTSSAFAS
jgi:hypothetical protein